MKYDNLPTIKSTYFLVISYGNQLRSDDGIGQQVSDEV